MKPSPPPGGRLAAYIDRLDPDNQRAIRDLIRIAPWLAVFAAPKRKAVGQRHRPGQLARSDVLAALTKLREAKAAWPDDDDWAEIVRLVAGRAGRPKGTV